MISFSSAPQESLICHLSFLICECKSINYFLINKTFFDIFFKTVSRTISYVSLT